MWCLYHNSWHIFLACHNNGNFGIVVLCLFFFIVVFYIFLCLIILLLPLFSLHGDPEARLESHYLVHFMGRPLMRVPHMGAIITESSSQWFSDFALVLSLSTLLKAAFTALAFTYSNKLSPRMSSYIWSLSRNRQSQEIPYAYRWGQIPEYAYWSVNNVISLTENFFVYW